MKKMLSLVFVILLTVKVSDCIQQTQQPTKVSIINALNNVDDYTHELSEKGIIGNRTYRIYSFIGIDRRTLQFFEFTKIETEEYTFKLWQYFDGSYVYFRVEDSEKNITRGGKASIDEIYKNMSIYYKNMSREEFIEMTVKTKDVLNNLKKMIENATITSIENDGELYKITFTLTRHYEKAPTFLNTNAENSEAIQGYINTLRRNVTENITGIVWVNNKSLPVKFKVEKSIIEKYRAANVTMHRHVEYNVTVTYKYQLPEWVYEVEKK
ncbi:hypothetical protein [Thermococcus barophilus]|uniref:Uncharacterized protein n=1 Tax=Thermococcus barophilus (strain DSM 11836 / MP) TaxID=391623 RepID=F0LI54_THEBM|nr:hypothetical protein [Thermococcus barophilus]ADT83208.1 hypothetical protein TERMP_00231 [Thermococcus barophilus MP]